MSRKHRKPICINNQYGSMITIFPTAPSVSIDDSMDSTHHGNVLGHSNGIVEQTLERVTNKLIQKPIVKCRAEIIIEELEKMRKETPEPISPTLPDCDPFNEYALSDKRIHLEMEKEVSTIELKTSKNTVIIDKPQPDVNNISIGDNDGGSTQGTDVHHHNQNTESPKLQMVNEKENNVNDEKIHIQENDVTMNKCPPKENEKMEVQSKTSKKKAPVVLQSEISSQTSTGVEKTTKNKKKEKKVTGTMYTIKRRDVVLDDLESQQELDDALLNDMLKNNEKVQHEIVDAMDEEEEEELAQLYQHSKENDKYIIRKRKQLEPSKIEKNEKMKKKFMYSYQSKMNPKYIEKKMLHSILTEILQENDDLDSKGLKFSKVSEDILHEVAEEYLESTFDGIGELIRMNNKITTLSLKYLYFYLKVQSNPNIHGKLSEESDEYMKFMEN